MIRARCNARLTAGWLSSSRDAAAVMLFSSAIAANVIRRFKSICRSFSRRMAAMTILHEPHVVKESSFDCVRKKSAQGEFHAAGKRFAAQAGDCAGRFVGNWFAGRQAGGVAGSERGYRFQ